MTLLRGKSFYTERGGGSRRAEGGGRRNRGQRALRELSQHAKGTKGLREESARAFKEVKKLNMRHQRTDLLARTEQSARCDTVVLIWNQKSKDEKAGSSGDL